MFLVIADSSAQRHNAADERVHAAEARANEAEYIERENTKQYIIKKRMLIQEMQTALEECKRRMLANGLDFPEINMKPWSQHRQDEVSTMHQSYRNIILFCCPV
jgi:heme oxygenase